MPSNSRAKRRQEETDTPDGTGPVAKVARVANAVEETEAQEGDATPNILLTTEKMMDLLKDLWSDDGSVIVRALTEIADISSENTWWDENEVKMRELGGHIAVFQLVQKHVGCLEIQKQGMRALGNFCRLIPTRKLLGNIGCVEVILARMEEYPDCDRYQLLGCSAIANLVRMKDNTERVKKSGGMAVVIAAMKTHPNNETLQSHGCRAFSSMSYWKEYRPLIVKAGGPSAIGFVMEKYSDHPALHERAYKTMERLFQTPR